MKVNQFRFCLSLGIVVLGCLIVGNFHTLLHPHLPIQISLLMCLSFGLIFWILTSPTFFNKYVGPATPESLGAIRIITCAALLITTLWFFDLPSSALLPAEMREPLGMLQFFYGIPGFEQFVRNQFSLQIFEWLTALILFLGLIGWQTKFVIPLGTICLLLLASIILHYVREAHAGLTATYILAVLSFTPCGDGLSVDRFLRVSRRLPVPVADRPLNVYGWSRYACWTVIAGTYVAAGLSKLRQGGFFWWNSTNMRYILLNCTLDPTQWGFTWSLQLHHAPDIIFVLLGILGLYGELAYGLVLFSQIARQIIPLLMLVMHIGILFLQNILFLDSILLQFIFFDYTQVKKSLYYWLIKNNLLEGMLKESKINPQTSSAILNERNLLKSFKYPLVISGFIFTLMFCWLYRIEFYPLTAMQMFSNSNTSGVVTYHKLMAYYESGNREKFEPIKIIPTMFDTRTRTITKMCFLKAEVKFNKCSSFMNSLITIHNNQVTQEEKIKKIEVQRWEWDFHSHPQDTQYGNLVDRHIFLPGGNRES